MAQTGFTPISNYYSATTTNVPTAGNLVAGELALNTADGKLFYKDSGGVVQTLATKSTTAGTFTSVTTNQLTIGTTQLGAGNASMLKNRIINGAMVVAQRGTSAVSSGSYPVDRFIMVSTSSATTTAQQSSTVPSSATFQNSVVYSVTTGASSGASDRQHLYQRIEGYNIADLGWGTANAKTVTLSFWAYASLAGTYSASFSNSAQTRSYVASYTLVANTWTQVSLTVAGDTSGTWLTTNGTGIQISWDYGSGSSFTGTANTWSGSYYLAVTGQAALSATTGATFYITGVQLEVGSSATGFEYRQYGQELALCQRYYEYSDSASYLTYYSATLALANIQYKVQKRAAPTCVVYLPSNGSIAITSESTWQSYLSISSAPTGFYSQFTASAEL